MYMRLTKRELVGMLLANIEALERETLCRLNPLMSARFATSTASKGLSGAQTG